MQCSPNIRKLRYRLAAILFSLNSVTAAAQVAEFEIVGVTDELATNIRSHLEATRLECNAPRTRLNTVLPRIRQQVVRASRALGYYQTEVSVHSSRDEEVSPCWNLQLSVDPGPRIIVSDVNIELTSDQGFFTNALTNLPLRVGDPLNQANYERIKGMLNSAAIEEGFFTAAITESILQLNLEDNTAQASIQFDPGPRFQVGEIRIQGQSVLSDEFLQRYLNLQLGDFYSSSSILATRRSLNESQYFSRVSVAPAHSEANNGRIPLDVDLEMRARRAFDIGGGVTTDIGPRLRANFENRYLTSSGHQFLINSSVSPIRQQIDFGYEIPLANPRTQRLSISLGHLREDVDAYETQTDKLGVNYSFLDRFGWRRDYFLNFQHDQYQLQDEPEDRSDLLIPGIRIARTEANDTLYPTKGWRVFAQLSGAHDDLVSTESFLQFNVTGKTLFTVGPGRLILRAEAGTTLVDDILDLPVSLQYFAGGDQSIRGYEYQSLGPIDSEGLVVGGQHQFIASAEYDFEIRPNWKLAVFTDAGNAFNEVSEFEFKRSAGIGIRWLSPIGPIRLDLASALDDGNRFRVHLSMGPDL